MAAAGESAAGPTDYVRIKRKKTTMFLYTEPQDTVHDLRAKVNHITKVPTTDVKFFIDTEGEVPVDENKTLADQKIQNEDVLYMIYRKEGSDEWEDIELAWADGVPPSPSA